MAAAVATLLAGATIAPGRATTQVAPRPGSGQPMPLVGSAFTILGAHAPAVALANLARAGVRAIRQDFTWADIERHRGVYDFRGQDAVVDGAAAHGLEVIAILDYGNPLYSTPGAAVQASPLASSLPPFGIGSATLFPPDPSHLDTFRSFTRATAAHFAGRVHRYEIWNEENEGWRFWSPHEDPAAYAALLAAGATGVRAADPTALISVGGVFWPEVPPGLPGQGGLRYLGHVYDADPDLGSRVDALAWHPYPYPFVAPEVVIPANSSVPGSAAQVRALAAARHDGHEQLWVTELGWPTNDREYGVSEARQAAYLVRGFAELWTEGVQVVVWYTYADGPNAALNQEDAFGLFRHDGTPKPSYAALATFSTELGAAVLRGARTDVRGLGPDGHALAFSAPGHRVTLLWTSPESSTSGYGPFPAPDGTRVVTVPVTGPASVVTLTGQVSAVPVSDGRATVEVSAAPVYLIDAA